jgi:hypothetical protein
VSGVAVFFVGMVVGAIFGIMAMAAVTISRGDDDDEP